MTQLGDALIGGSLLIVLWNRSRIPHSLLMIIALLFTFLMVQIGKRLLFSDWPRPLGLFEEELVYAPFTKNRYHGFPSGHTATAFCLAGCLMLRKRWSLLASFLVVIVATLVGYSRIYLGLHFLADVLAGAFMGSLSSLFAYYFLGSWAHQIQERVPAKRKIQLERGLLGLAAMCFLIGVLNRIGPQFYT
jgi:membrane-associated phospholipid phosphatase